MEQRGGNANAGCLGGDAASSAAAAAAAASTVHETLLQRIEALDRSSVGHDGYTPLVVGGRPVGQVQNTIRDVLLGECRDAQGEPVFIMLAIMGPDVGLCRPVLKRGLLALGLAVDAQMELVNGEVCSRLKSDPTNPPSDTSEGAVAARSAALHCATLTLIAANCIKKVHGELFPVAARFGAAALALVDRNMAPVLGVTCTGVHLICYVRGGPAVPGSTTVSTTADAEPSTVAPPAPVSGVWLSQRALDKSSFPGCWDPTAAGGHPHGIGLQKNMQKEAWEEAGLPEELSRTATSSGCLSFMSAKKDGSCLKQSLYFIWDCNVPAAWTPTAVDGEVADFQLCSLADVEEEVRVGTAKLRPNMRAVMVDFLMRHGAITPDAEPEYAGIANALHKEKLMLMPEGKYNYVP